MMVVVKIVVIMIMIVVMFKMTTVGMMMLLMTIFASNNQTFLPNHLNSFHNVHIKLNISRVDENASEMLKGEIFENISMR